MNLLNCIMLPGMRFFRIALCVGLLSSIALGIIGTMVVTRRISSLAGAMAHAALGGVAAALFMRGVFPGLDPLLGALAGAVTAALAVGAARIVAGEREDTLINVVWALWMSAGMLFLHHTPGYVDWEGYLFGSILLLTGRDIILTLVLDLIILIPCALFYNQLLSASFDELFSELRGIRVRLIYFVLLVMTAFTIVLLLNMVGVILVISLLTLPAAAAGCFTRRLSSMMTLAGVLDALFVTAGLLASFTFDLPPGPAITVLLALAYVAALCFRRK